MKHASSMVAFLSIKIETSLASFNTGNSQVKKYYFGTDGLDFSSDDCANVSICNVNEVFNNIIELSLPTDITAVDEKAMSKRIGKISQSWKDDNGANNEKIFKYFYYVPKHLSITLSTPKLSQQIQAANEELPTGTCASTYPFHSAFVQEKVQHVKTITHPESMIPSTCFNIDFEVFHTFCACVNKISNEKFTALATN